MPEYRSEFLKRYLLHMKKLIVPVLFVLMAQASMAQEVKGIADPLTSFRQAKEYYQKEYYSLAYPIFKELNLGLSERDRSGQALNYQEIKYYTIVCALKQNEAGA